MIPNNVKYPEFVPDQLLTSDNLNQLFGYLDEQGRMTRTNLLGIGIVCGFDVTTAADGTFIKVSKGTGITSEGYLVAQDDATYTQRIDFNPAQEVYYDKFLTAAHTGKFKLWELKRGAAVPGAVLLTKSFLNGDGVDSERKVVLIFVELLEEANKNCNPESCDDKGITLNVNLRLLLVRQQDAATFNLTAGMGEIYYSQSYVTLPEMRMQRFDVAASGIVSAGGLFSAYKKILSAAFMKEVQKLLSSAWNSFLPLVGSEYGNQNPFPDLAEKFSFLNHKSISATQLRNIQYLYDHFSDLLAAYDELRRTGMEVLGTCCPDSSLFPRHLLLDLAIHDNTQLHSSYRHHFRYSPLFQKRDLYGRLRSLFRRLVLMASEFQVPIVTGSNDNPDGFIRITPSRLDASAISSKAIPFYYSRTDPFSIPLLEHWNYESTQAKRAEQNLSYHAGDYARKDFVANPLKYDLEPYNFLRIEGHVGKPFSHVLSNLKNRIKENRLPIDVIALAMGTDATGTEISDPKVVHDIQAQYEVIRSEVLCCLKRQVPYWGNLKLRDPKPGGLNLVSNFFLNIVELNTVEATVGEVEGGGVRFLKSTAKEPLNAEAAIQPVKTTEVSRKAELLTSAMGIILDTSLASEYLRFQELGDVNLSRIPPPVNAVFDTTTITHYALIIIDEIQAIMALLDPPTSAPGSAPLTADDLLTLDIAALETHRDTLEKALDTLSTLVTQKLESQKVFMKIKAYVGEAQNARVEAIAGAMPDLKEENVGTIVLLLLNLSDAEKTSMILQLSARKNSPTAQQSVLKAFVARLDKDGMMIPPEKDVTAVDDPFLLEMRERLKNFNCLCLLAGFKKLLALLQTLIDESKQANLFHNFSGKHPGLQHKAGVTMGGTFIVVYHRTGGTNPEKPDPIFARLTEEMPDGIVVADFYLPYLSYSNQPPIVYQVTDAEPIPARVELKLAPNPKTGTLKYSVGDETAYHFSHSPSTNGFLTNGTPGNGVTSSRPDAFAFTPSKTKDLLGNNPSVDLTFTYVKMGVVSPEVKVTVLHLPVVSIKPSDESTDFSVGSKVSFIVDTPFGGDKFSWTVKDAAGKVDIVATSRELSNFPLSTEGTFAFTLQVNQSETGAMALSNSVNITVKKVPDAPVKTCGSLASIGDDFKKLEGIDEKQFKGFDSQFLREIGIDAYFADLLKVVPLDETAQFDFFRKPLRNGSSLTDNLTSWLDRFAGLILDPAAEVFRLLALETYRLLTDLLMYVSCISPEDIGKSEEQLFVNIANHLKGIVSLRQLSPAEKVKLEQFRVEIAAEVERQNSNSNIKAKPKYERALATVFAAFPKS